jgi:hypothetical protein
MSDTITPRRAMLIWCLLGRHGWAFQKDIVPKVEKSDREALVASGHVASEKRGNAFLLTVEDKGWGWAAGHLRAELPPNYRVLQDWLARLDQHLERSGATLADFIGTAPVAPPPEKEKKRKSGTPKTPKHPKPATAKHVRQRLEEAYLAVTGGRKATQALLSKVRAELADLDRETVDQGLLLILQGDKQGRNKARLGQVSDPKALTQEDREAAFSPAGEPFHLLWIQS